MNKDILKRPPQTGGGHYGKGLQPWDLQCHMRSTGDVFVDARRTDVMEYVFRLKTREGESTLTTLREDAVKALHNLESMIARIDQLQPVSQPHFGPNDVENYHVPVAVEGAK